MSSVEIPDLKLWITADRGVRTSAGIAISSDQSGNEVHGEQADAGKVPEILEDGINGQPVFRFDGTDDDIPVKGLMYNSAGSLPNGITIGAVVKVDPATNGGIIISSWDRSALTVPEREGLETRLSELWGRAHPVHDLFSYTKIRS